MPLPKFDPRTAPVVGIDRHLAPVEARQLTPAAPRRRFQNPPAWTPKHSAEMTSPSRLPVAAAVLIALVMRQELMLLLTQRTDNLSTHPGQIALPGGRSDEADADAVATALREAQEEIALPRSYVDVLGLLPTYATGTGFVITPVVALVRTGFTLERNPGEVADIFEVPISYLMNPAHHRWHEHTSEGVMRQWLSMPYLHSGVRPSELGPQERFIWGATAGMLRNLYCFLSA